MRVIPDRRLRAAFAEIDRQGFLPEYQRRFAGDDRPLDIGYGQTNSQPSTVAAMIELLDVCEGQRILDVGAGSGWTTALLGRLVGPTGRVVGVEIVADLARWGAGNVAAHGLDWATIQEPEPGVFGVPEQGPYDRILVSAGASEVPDELLDQLADGGLLVMPVRSRMLVLRRNADGSIATEVHGSYSFVPLVRWRR